MSALEKFENIEVIDVRINDFEDFKSRLDSLKSDVIAHIEKFEFGFASEDIYESFWHDYCDKMIELSKKYISAFEETSGSNQEKIYVMKVMFDALKTYLKLLHPFMPFITEEIFQTIRGESDPTFLMIADWPVV